MQIKAILREIQDKTGWNQQELAKRLKVEQPTISRWFKGSAPKSHHERGIMALARELQIIKHTGGSRLHVPIVGYIGAGGDVVYAEGQGPFGEAPMPPGGDKHTVAVEVRGDSMAGLLENGAIVYYDNRQEPPTEALHGRLCVVGLSDGRVLVKKLLPGRKPGFYDLYSVAAAPLLDQAVEWAAKVAFIGFN